MAEEPNEDLSMDDILSSIRNILMEDNAAQQSVPQPAPQTEKKAEPVSAPAAELPPAINTADELNTADQDDELSAEALLGLGDNAQASDAPEDDVFNLSPSMIVDEALDEPVLSNPADNEPEISEDDILDLSRLAAPSADELIVTLKDGREQRFYFSEMEEEGGVPAVKMEEWKEGVLLREEHTVCD